MFRTMECHSGCFSDILEPRLEKVKVSDLRGGDTILWRAEDGKIKSGVVNSVWIKDEEGYYVPVERHDRKFIEHFRVPSIDFEVYRAV